jgi:hypothetical protein
VRRFIYDRSTRALGTVDALTVFNYPVVDARCCA